MTEIDAIPTIPDQTAGVLIGALWISSAVQLRAAALSKLKPTDFGGADRNLFASLAAHGVKASYALLEQKLSEPERARLREIQTVFMGSPSLDEGIMWIDKVKKQGMNREFRFGLDGITSEIKADSDPMDIAGKVIRLVGEIQGRDNAGKVLEFAQTDKVKALTAEWRKGNKYVGAVPTGFKELDGHLGGLKRGHVTTVAAPRGFGKTQWCLQAMERVAMQIVADKRDAATLIFSAEMTFTELQQRLAQSRSKISMRWLKEKYEHKDLGKPQDKHYDQFDAAIDALGKLPIKVCDQSQPTTDYMLNIALAEKAQYKDGLDLIVFDYLMLAGDKSNNDNETIRIGKIMWNLKRIARECNCPVIVIAHLNRESERTEAKEPELDQLKQSSEIENVSNAVLLIDRPEVYRKPDGFKNDDLRKRDQSYRSQGGNCAIKIAKNRDGEANRFIVLQFMASVTCFEERSSNPIAVL